MRELTFYQNELSKVEEQLSSILRQGKAAACLQSVPGVGQVVATAFMLELFCPERFRRAEEVTSYLGLAPMVHHGGEKTLSGKLLPVGQNGRGLIPSAQIEKFLIKRIEK